MRRTLRRFPPISDESRFCRDGRHVTVLTPFGQAVANVFLALAVASVARWLCGVL